MLPPELVCLSGTKGHPQSLYHQRADGSGAGLSLASVHNFLLPDLVSLLMHSLCTLGFPGLLGLTSVSL